MPSATQLYPLLQHPELSRNPLRPLPDSVGLPLFTSDLAAQVRRAGTSVCYSQEQGGESESGGGDKDGYGTGDEGAGTGIGTGMGLEAGVRPRVIQKHRRRSRAPHRTFARAYPGVLQACAARLIYLLSETTKHQATPQCVFVFFLGGGGASGHGKLAKPAHQKALEKSLRIKDQSCPMLRLSHKAMW